MSRERTNVVLERAKVQCAAAVLGTHGLSDTVDAALDRVLADEGLRRLADGTYDFSGVGDELDATRAARRIGPDAG